MTFLEYLIRRVKKLDFIDNIIIATTINPKDLEIVGIAKKLKVKYFRGSEENVLDRIIKAAQKFKTEIIVRVTSDCPVIDLDLIYQAYYVYKNNKSDYVSNGFIRSYPLGMDVEVFSLKVLRKSLRFANNPECKEHITLAIRRNPKEFDHLNLIAPKSLKYPKIGLTLDYKEDLILLKKIIKYFWNKNYNCKDIIEYLSKNKKVAKLNNHVKRTIYKY